MPDAVQESVPTVVLNRAFFGFGLLLYILSFFLIATGDSKGIVRMRGLELRFTSHRSSR